MEIEYFIKPGDSEWKFHHNEWIKVRKSWFSSIGLKAESLGEEVHPKDKLAHYAKSMHGHHLQISLENMNLRALQPEEILTLVNINSIQVKNLEFFDENLKQRYLPHVIEPSLGVDRTFLAVLCSAYSVDEIEGEKRTVLAFHPRVAPIKAGIFPLVKNKPELVELASNLYRKLQKRWNVIYDQSGAIGRRYRRIDEAGVPFGITVDFDTLEGDGSFTLRDRDTTEQVRL